MAFDLLPRLNDQVWKLRKNPRGPETNSKFASENGWLEDEISFRIAFSRAFCCRIPSGDEILAYTFVGF